MPSTVLPVLIDPTCASHPLLPKRYRGNLPAWTGISLSPKKLFGYAAMQLQDASRSSVKSYAVVRRKADSFIDIYGEAVTYRPAGLDIGGDSETKGRVSELVGIGAGLAAACEVFDLNPNRISRYISNATGKRMDYEFTVRGRSHLLEVRGTTGVGTQRSMITAVGPKKTAPSSQAYTSRAGVVTLYAQGDGQDHAVIVDPPAGSGEAGEYDELSAVLEYYHNIYRLTHSAEAFLHKLQFWVERQRQGLVDAPPSPPTRDELPRHRVSFDVHGVGLVRGTFYDRRLLSSSVSRFRSFDEATVELPSPTWLIGTLPALDEIMAAGQWRRLLEFSAEPAAADLEGDSTVLRSGVAVVPMRLTDDEERVLRSSFQVMRRRYQADEGS